MSKFFDVSLSYILSETEYHCAFLWLYRLFESNTRRPRLTSKPMIVKTFEIRKILRRLQILIRMVVMTIPCAIMERFLHRFVKATNVIINDVSTVPSVICFWQSQCTCYQGKCYYFLRVDLHGKIFTYANRMRQITPQLQRNINSVD